MTLSTRMISVLTAVGLLSGGLLTGVGILTKDRIAFNKQQEIEAAILLVVPGAETHQKVFEERDLVVYHCRDKTGDVIGYALYALGAGFQDKIALMYGTDAALSKINSLTILEQLETPGLGAKITDQEAFLRFWENKDVSQPLTLHKPAASSPDDLAPSEINTITGATISSESVLKIVNLSLDRIKALRDSGKLGGGN